MGTQSKTQLISAAAVALIIVGIIVYVLLPGPQASTPSTTATSTAAKSAVYTQNGTYDHIAANYPVTPPFSGAKGQAALATMRAFVVGNAKQFALEGGFATMTPARAQAMSLSSSSPYTFQTKYLIGSSAHTVSYIFTTYTYTGGAHGMTNFKTFVFNKQTGKQLTLADVFTPSSQYLQVLSQQSRLNLEQQLGSTTVQAMLQPGTAPTASNFQDFFFDNNQFVLLFPPYQVAPYAAGPQTVRIPATKLATELNSQYP